MLLPHPHEEPVELEFAAHDAAAIIPASQPIANDHDKPMSKRKVQSIVNKNKRKRNADPNYNPLLPESAERDLSDTEHDTATEIAVHTSSNQRMHEFTLTTTTSQIEEKKAPSCRFYNLYCMLICSNLFLIGSLLLLIHDYIVDALGVILVVVGLALNTYTIWTFCGERICPRFFRHENQLVFDDDEKTIFIHWNGLIKASTVRYAEFARLYTKLSESGKYCAVLLATSGSHYRFNKYLASPASANAFVATVNNWWNVDRLEANKRRYSNAALMLNNARQRKQANVDSAQKSESKESEQTEEERHLQHEEELSQLIKKLKYKSFSTKDIEDAGKLKQFFESRFRGKMVEQYEAIKIDLDKQRNAANEQDAEFMMKNEHKYIASALLLTLETMEQLMEQRKMQKLQMMINENKRNLITFSEEEVSDDDGKDEEKLDTLEAEQEEERANGANSDVL